MKFLRNLRLPLKIGALCLLLAMLAHFTHTRLWESDGLNNRVLIGDNTIFFAAAEAVCAGTTPYVPSGSSEHPGALYCYPPLLAVLLSPLAALPIWTINLLCYALISGCFIGSFYLLFRLAQLAGFAPPPGWSLIVFMILAVMFFEPIQNNYFYAQANAPILLCCLLFIDLFLRKWPKLAAICAAFGAAIKLFPLIFFPFLFWRRRWVALATGVVALLCFSCLSLLVAPDGYYHDYVWALRARAGSSYDYTEFFATLYRSVIWFIPGIASKITELLCAAGLMLALMLCDLHYGKRRGHNAASTLWTLLVLCNFILLIHPHTESHVMIFCIPAFALSGLWAFFRGSWLERVLFALSYLLYVPLLAVQETPLTFLSLFLNSLLCILIQYRSPLPQADTANASMASCDDCDSQP